MTAGVYDSWADERARQGGWRQLPLATIISIAVHVVIVLAILITVAPEAWHLSDRTQYEFPAVEVVPATTIQHVRAPEPDFVVTTDHPSNALPPPVRRVFETPSDLVARPDSPTHITGMSTVDLEALEDFVRATEQAEQANPGQGWTWTTCSLLPPERRALEPACDGLLLKGRPNPDGPGVAVSLETPDGEVLAAIKRYEKSQDQKPKPNKTRGNDDSQDRSFRNESDEYFGPRPWE